MLDLGVLERGGQAVRANGRANRLRGNALLDIDASATTWTVAGKGRLQARCLGRPLLWLAGRRIRRSINHAFAEFWAAGESHTIGLELQLSELRTVIENEGGLARFVRRAIWDQDFDPGLRSLRKTAT